MFSRSIIDDYLTVIDSSTVMLQLVASFMIVIYDHHIFKIKATGANGKIQNPYPIIVGRELYHRVIRAQPGPML
jgi:hypothetical protein